MRCGAVFSWWAAMALVTACGPGKGSGETATETATTGPQTCDAFLSDAEIGPEVEITLVNDGSAPVWLATIGCGETPVFQLVDSERVDHAKFHSCETRACGLLVEGHCEDTCNNCAPPRALRVDPGGSFTTKWRGIFREEMTMSAECAADEACQGECIADRQAAPGAYEVRVEAFAACTGDCVCDGPAVDGWCRLFGSLETSQPRTLVAQLSYPEVTALVVPLTTP